MNHGQKTHQIRTSNRTQRGLANDNFLNKSTPRVNVLYILLTNTINIIVS